MTSEAVAAGWEEMTANPVFGIALTLGVFLAAEKTWHRSGRHPLLTPVFTTVAVIASLLLLMGVPYEDYLAGAGYIGFLLAPATVALAVTIYRNLPLVMQASAPVLISVLTGAGAGIASGYFVTKWLGGSQDLAVAMMAKSVTTPVAMALTEQAGGIPELSAAFTMVTGVLGAVAAPTLMNWARIGDVRVRGLAMGISSHGIGTAQVLVENETEGAFAALGMALSTIAASVLIPIFVSFVM